MGATDSKDTLDESLSENSTPQRTPEKNQKVLKLNDPRSPTDGIERTPIVKSMTAQPFQDPRSPTVEIARTPCPDSSNDPRSPTEGIPRTPANPFFFPDPRSPTVHVARTPLSKTEPQMDTLHEETADDKMKLIKEDSKESLSEKGEHPDPQTEDDTNDEPSMTDTNDASTIGTPTFEMELSKMKLEESNPNEVLDESMSATLILSAKGKSRKPQSSLAKRSLKEKFQMSGSQSRSPLSTRNLVHDSPCSDDTASLVQKRSSRNSRPTRLVGRYEPVVDKENM